MPFQVCYEANISKGLPAIGGLGLDRPLGSGKEVEWQVLDGVRSPSRIF